MNCYLCERKNYFHYDLDTVSFLLKAKFWLFDEFFDFSHFFEISSHKIPCKIVLLYEKYPKKPFLAFLVKGNCHFFAKIMRVFKQLNTWILTDLVKNRLFWKFLPKYEIFVGKISKNTFFAVLIKVNCYFFVKIIWLLE